LEARQFGRRHACSEEDAAPLAIDPSYILHHLPTGAHIVGDRAESRLASDGALLHAIGPEFVALEIVALRNRWRAGNSARSRLSAWLWPPKRRLGGTEVPLQAEARATLRRKASDNWRRPAGSFALESCLTIHVYLTARS